MRAEDTQHCPLVYIHRCMCAYTAHACTYQHTSTHVFVLFEVQSLVFTLLGELNEINLLLQLLSQSILFAHSGLFYHRKPLQKAQLRAMAGGSGVAGKIIYSFGKNPNQGHHCKSLNKYWERGCSPRGPEFSSQHLNLQAFLLALEGTYRCAHTLTRTF